MNFVVVASVSTIVLCHPFNKSRLLIGLNRIFLCLNHSSQIPKTRSWWFNSKEVLQFLERLMLGDFGRNAHRGTRWRSMQSFGGLFHSKITWAGIGLIEGCNRRKCTLNNCSLKLSSHCWWGFDVCNCIQFGRDRGGCKYKDLKLKWCRQRIWL